MADYSQAADSQAAYANMPDQGLSSSGFGSSMTSEQRRQMAAQMLMKGFQPNSQAIQGGAAPVRQAQPTQTLSAGQFVNGMGGR
jgi:hypothetical protein